MTYPSKIRFAEGYGVLLILLMVIQAIANDKFIEVQQNAERARKYPGKVK
ncbi:pathogenicity island 2 effector protein SseB [Salmonella enterica subsp. enterica]|uniref:Pathogenicity island 2 effector protein SseB n=1 Tax=Salmonella enterica I TaxID=59201 RepID=A0A379VRC7_SALET|nr:pathogenicity island 2 effector protein SseB [Salmonella enterica subsp. enterica]